MKDNEFKALVLTQDGKQTIATLQTLTTEDLPPGEVLVAVAYSSLNYKDGLAITGKGKIVRQFPMVPGIDLAGTVLASTASSYQPGDQVVLTGWGVGERHWGGYSQKQRVRADWLVPLPAGLTMQQAMVVGTAGFTAMLCLLALEDAGLTPAVEKPVLVTGASGGVGSMAAALLTNRGYQVTAVTGRPENQAYLRSLGVSAFLSREEMGKPAQPLQTQRWAGAVDTVGGDMLARVLAEIAYGGAVAACGLAGGADLPTTVMPFILRAVKLLGIDSVQCPLPRRKLAWSRLVQDLSSEALEQIGHVASLEAVPQLAEDIVAGKVRGRVVVDLNN